MPDPNEPQMTREYLEPPKETPLVDRLQNLHRKGIDFIGRGDDRVELRDVIIALQSDVVVVSRRPGHDSVEQLTDKLEALGGAADDEAAAARAELVAREASQGGPDASENGVEGDAVIAAGVAREATEDARRIELRQPGPLSPEPIGGLPSPERELPDQEPDLPAPQPPFPGSGTGDAPPSGEGKGTADPPPSGERATTVRVPEVVEDAGA